MSHLEAGDSRAADVDALLPPNKVSARENSYYFLKHLFPIFVIQVIAYGDDPRHVLHAKRHSVVTLAAFVARACVVHAVTVAVFESTVHKSVSLRAAFLQTRKQVHNFPHSPT